MSNKVSSSGGSRPRRLLVPSCTLVLVLERNDSRPLSEDNSTLRCSRGLLAHPLDAHQHIYASAQPCVRRPWRRADTLEHAKGSQQRRPEGLASRTFRGPDEVQLQVCTWHHYIRHGAPPASTSGNGHSSSSVHFVFTKSAMTAVITELNRQDQFGRQKRTNVAPRPSYLAVHGFFPGLSGNPWRILQMVPQASKGLQGWHKQPSGDRRSPVHNGFGFCCHVDLPVLIPTPWWPTGDWSAGTPWAPRGL